MGSQRSDLERLREDVNRRLKHLEHWTKQHDEQHEPNETESGGRAVKARDRRRWTWQQILTAAAAAATVGEFWLNALGR